LISIVKSVSVFAKAETNTVLSIRALTEPLPMTEQTGTILRNIRQIEKKSERGEVCNVNNDFDADRGFSNDPHGMFKNHCQATIPSQYTR